MDTFIILYSKFSEVSKNFINYILKNSRIKFKFLCLDFITVREKIVEIMGINELPCVIIIRNEQIEIYSGKDAYKLSEEMSRQELELKSELPKEKVNNTRLNKSSATIGGDRPARLAHGAPEHCASGSGTPRSAHASPGPAGVDPGGGGPPAGRRRRGP